MTIRRGLMARTSGVPIPVTLDIRGQRIKLREFVITTALASENRTLTKGEEESIFTIARSLRTEYSDCWKLHMNTQQCKGIQRAARILINLLYHHPRRGRKKEVEDLKRWIEYGKRI